MRTKLFKQRRYMIRMIGFIIRWWNNKKWTNKWKMINEQINNVISVGLIPIQKDIMIYLCVWFANELELCATESLFEQLKKIQSTKLLDVLHQAWKCFFFFVCLFVPRGVYVHLKYVFQPNVSRCHQCHKIFFFVLQSSAQNELLR